jgi:ClpP class serine protease
MWREIRLLADSKPVIASMSDVAASGGYYMAMAAPVIVAEKLTLTGSIGVVTGDPYYLVFVVARLAISLPHRILSSLASVSTLKLHLLYSISEFR